MIPRLRTFGGLSIESAHPLTGAATQRRPLAFLALLAIAGSRGMSRDRLIAMLWPESDAEHAQNSLSQVLSALRRELADEVVTAAPVLRLNPDVIASDVAEFQERLDSGDLEIAAAVYTGPFLDGFFIRNAPEFEHWVDQERSRLHHLQADALERLASTASERADNAAAVRWCRQRASLTPTDSNAARALMEALVAAGDQAGALEHFRIHQSLMRAELELEPDSALSEFALALRAEPPPTSTRPNASGGVGERGSGAGAAAPFPVASPSAAPPPRRRISRLGGVALAVVLTTTAIVIALTSYGSALTGTQRPTPGPTLRRKLTFTGNALMASLSADGQFLAYAGQAGDSQHVVVHDLTSDAADTVAAVQGRYPGVVTVEWSPDGKRLLVGTEGRALVLPRLRGAARTLMPNELQGFEVYAYWVSGSRVSLHGVLKKHVTLFDTAAFGDSVVVPVGGEYTYLLEGSWSRDGRHFAVKTVSAEPVRFGISVVGPDNRHTERIVEDSVWVNSPRWSSDGTIVYYTRAPDELWRVRVDPRSGRARGTPTLVQRDLQMLSARFGLQQFSITPDGRRLVYPQGSRFSNIYVLEPDRRDAVPPRSDTLTSGTALRWSPRASPDGRWIAFAEQTSGSADLFRVPIDGGPVERLTFGARIWAQSEIAWSPDGKQIAFETIRGNHAQIWIADVDGGRMRGFERTRVSIATGHLTWAPGAEIAYQRLDHHSIDLVDPVTGHERTLVRDTVGVLYSPLYSPDGKHIAATWLRSPGDFGVWMFDPSKSTSAKVGDGLFWPRSWTADGRYMYAYPPMLPTLFRIDASGKKPVQRHWVPPFTFAECTAAGPRRPGAFVCVKFDFVSDIWVIENFDH